MNAGTIQANAKSGKGGNVILNLEALVPSSNTLNGRPFTSNDALLPTPDNVEPVNVIEAVSDTGVSGTINLSAPQLNLSGTIANIGNAAFDTSRAAPASCSSEPGSSIRTQGRGGLLPGAGELPLF